MPSYPSFVGSKAKCKELGHNRTSWYGDPCRCSTCENWNGCGAGIPKYVNCEDCKKCSTCQAPSVMRVGDLTYCRKCSKLAIDEVKANDPSDAEYIYTLYSEATVIEWLRTGTRCPFCRLRAQHRDGKCVDCLLDEYRRENPDPSDESVQYRMCEDKIRWIVDYYNCACRYCSGTWRARVRDTVCMQCAIDGKNPDVKVLDNKGKRIVKVRVMSKSRHSWRTTIDARMDHKCSCGCRD